MAEDPTFEVTHQRITTLYMNQVEIEALIVAEAIRRAATRGIIVDLSKGMCTRAEVVWGESLQATVQIAEDIAP